MKSEFRDTILGRIKSLSTHDKAQASIVIQTHLKNTLANESGLWAGFQSLTGTEPQINWNEVSTQIEWAFPVTLENKLHFKKNVKNYSRQTLGVSEPLDGEAVDLEQISGFVVPALAFGQSGHRLGRGKGYYDRTLKNNNKKKIGVCFDLAFSKSVPHEEHDLICQQIITEKQVYQVTQVEGEQKWN